MALSKWIYIGLFLFSSFIFLSQSTLELTFVRFGRLKKYEFTAGDQLQYKLKGEHRLRANTIAALQDSIIAFDNESIVPLNSIKFIRIRNEDYHGHLFQSIFLIGAVAYPFLNFTNNAINHNTPLLNNQAMVVSASFLGAALIIRQLGIKRIHMTKNKRLNIVNIDFQHLNSK